MYDIGDKVVYPMHGAGIIEEIEDKMILGEIRKYYILNSKVFIGYSTEKFKIEAQNAVSSFKKNRRSCAATP